MKKNIYVLVFMLFTCILITCKQPKIIRKKPSQSNLEQFYWRDIVQSKYPDTTSLLNIFVDSVLAWNYTDTIHQEGRVYLYHFYGDFMGGNLASKTPDDFSYFGKLSSFLMLPYIERSPTLIKMIYEENKDALFTIIDSSKAYKLGLDILADDLIFTFDTLFSNKKPVNVFKKYKNTNYTTSDIMAIIRGGPSRIKNKIIYKPLSGYYEWIYTFWYRRYLENNMEECLKILRNIQQKYPVRKKYAWRNNWYSVTKNNRKNYLMQLTTEEQKEVSKIMKGVGLFSKHSL